MKARPVYVLWTLLAGCSSISVSHHDKTVDFSEYRTYAWRPGTAGFAEIRTPVEEELAARGLVVSMRDPDLLLIETLILRQVTRSTPDFFETYPKARVRIVAFDRVLGDTVWAASTRPILRPDKGGEHVVKEVRALIQRFPR